MPSTYRTDLPLLLGKEGATTNLVVWAYGASRHVIRDHRSLRRAKDPIAVPKRWKGCRSFAEGAVEL